MEKARLRIGQIAARSGVGAKALRFYEAKGLLAPPARSENGYRLYSPGTVDLLQFIKQAQGLGLALDEIREIIAIRQGGRPPCRHVHALLRQKAEELDRKLRDLLQLRKRIGASLAAWGRSGRQKATVCPHVEGRSRR